MRLVFFVFFLRLCCLVSHGSCLSVEVECDDSHAEMRAFARQNQTPVSLRQMVLIVVSLRVFILSCFTRLVCVFVIVSSSPQFQFGQKMRTGDHSAFINAAQFLQKELPIRLARRAVELDALPYGLSQMPSVTFVRSWYVFFLGAKQFSHSYEQLHG